MNISLMELSRRTGVNTHSLRRMVKGGQLEATRDEGRTGSWHFPEDTVRKVEELKTASLDVEESAELLDPNKWINSTVAAREAGVTVDAIHKRVKSGTLQARKVSGKLYVDAQRVKEVAQKRKGLKPSKTSTLPEGQNYTLREAANLLGVTPIMINNRITSGMIKGTLVQVGPKKRVWYVSAAAVEQLRSIFGTAKVPTPKGSRKLETNLSLPKPADLTQQFLDLAELIRANPMVVVNKMEVDISVRG